MSSKCASRFLLREVVPHWTPNTDAAFLSSFLLFTLNGSLSFLRVSIRNHCKNPASVLIFHVSECFIFTEDFYFPSQWLISHCRQSMMHSNLCVDRKVLSFQLIDFLVTQTIKNTLSSGLCFSFLCSFANYLWGFMCPSSVEDLTWKGKTPCAWLKTKMIAIML